MNRTEPPGSADDRAGRADRSLRDRTRHRAVDCVEGTRVRTPGGAPGDGGTARVARAALAYALTFLASDCYTELYGRRAAQIVVNVGFVLNFIVLALVWSTIAAPAAPSSVDPGAFETALGASTNVVLGACWPISSARTGT